MADLVDELKEDIMHEKYAKLWQDFGSYIIAAAIAVVLSTAGFVWWKSHNVASLEAKGSELYKAHVSELRGDIEGSRKIYENLLNDGSGSYSAIAGLRDAAILAGKGDSAGAIEIYGKIAADSSVPVEIKELAELLYLYDSISSGNNNSDIIARIENLSNSGMVFAASAKELLAFIKLQSGDNAAAIELFKALRDGVGTPYNMQDRAAEMLSYMNSKGLGNNG